MKFCPHCGGLLLPKQENGKFYLKCRECDYIEEVTAEEIEADPDYKLHFKVKHSPREKIIVIEESENTRKEEQDEDEMEERRKAILDMMMENMDSD